ncbi:hypothetical protein [Prevotella corporis]|uniref:Uncharacterized protein n=1 Tax=Prevotella corporis TaxID=28128 RepID=A0A133QF29_9BACT|nr:hypothetical protein [Prevotella corporis]KXA41487.1 hypothetical protein HMPREF3226_00824 [Prevotella corporis]
MIEIIKGHEDTQLLSPMTVFCGCSIAERHTTDGWVAINLTG